MGKARSLEYDSSTEATIIISYPHNKAHEGGRFSVSHKNDALADDGTINFVLTVGAKEAHLVFNGACGGDATVTVYEAASSISAGTVMTERNKNRVVGLVAEGNQTTVLRDATIGGAGNIIATMVLPGGTGGNSTGGSVSVRDEWIFAPSTIYAIILTNIAGAAKPCSLALDWYEHTPR